MKLLGLVLIAIATVMGWYEMSTHPQTIHGGVWVSVIFFGIIGISSLTIGFCGISLREFIRGDSLTVEKLRGYLDEN